MRKDRGKERKGEQRAQTQRDVGVPQQRGSSEVSRTAGLSVEIEEDAEAGTKPEQRRAEKEPASVLGI